MKLGDLAKLVPIEGVPMILALIGRVEELRALRDDESKLVELMVHKERRHAPRRLHKWTATDNRELLRVQHRPGGVKRFADARDITYKAAFQQLSRQRKLLRSGSSPERLEG